MIERVGERTTTAIATYFYGALGIVSLLGLWFFGDHSRGTAIFVDDRSVRSDLILGLGIGLLLAMVSRGLMRVVPDLHRLELDFARAFGPVTPPVASKLAILSGVAEELFFRGVLLPWLGIVGSTALFAAAHIGPGLRYWIWTCWSAVAGGAFAWMTVHSGNLTAAIVAHVAVNYLGLIWLGDRHVGRDRNSSDSPARAKPSAG